MGGNIDKVYSPPSLSPKSGQNNPKTRRSLGLRSVSKSGTLSLLWRLSLKPSHRSRPEQGVGFGIYLLICLGCGWMNGWLIQKSSFISPHWNLNASAYQTAWIANFFILSLSIWSLWRRYSLRVLKLEISAFFAQFAFQMAWAISFFVLAETRVALTFLVLLWINTLLAALLFWKKEKVSGGLLLPSFLWILYVMGVNMAICIFNP